MDAKNLNFPYTFIDLTQAVDVTPNQFGRVNELDIFPSTPAASEYVEIRFRNNEIVILEAKERGAETIVNRGPTENVVILKIPHFPEIDLITPKDIQNMYAFAQSQLRPKSLEDAMSERLDSIRRKHDITREFLRMGALKGIVKDGKDNTLINLHEVFGITPKTIDFKLGTADTDILGKCNELKTYMRMNLKGETMNGIHNLVDSVWFNKFIAHPNVEKFYLNWQQATALSGMVNPVFNFGGINWEQYDAVATNTLGDSVPFIEEKTGYAFPLGTVNTAKTYDGPVDDIRMANEPGVPVFVSPEELKHGAGVELKSQSNPLAVWSRPALLVKTYSSD